jgi:hypothetical protein
VGTVGGFRFYEHPELGDEVPLVVIVRGHGLQTHFWEVPTLEELVDCDFAATVVLNLPYEPPAEGNHVLSDERHI